MLNRPLNPYELVWLSEALGLFHASTVGYQKLANVRFLPQTAAYNPFRFEENPRLVHYAKSGLIK